jgi:hypothetical protein
VQCEVIQWVYDQPDNVLFQVEANLDFTYSPVEGSFHKTKCSVCGEYAFDRYLRMKDLFPLGLSFLALRTSALPADDYHTYDYHRLEVLGALTIGATPVFISFEIFSEAWGAGYPRLAC